MYNPVKLTKKTAVELIQSVFPVPKASITGPIGSNGAVRFSALVGSQTLEIICENDWFNHNGQIRLTLTDGQGGSAIRMYFNPETLNRDFAAEDAEKEEDHREARMLWVQQMGRENAIKFVEQSCEGGWA